MTKVAFTGDHSVYAHDSLELLRSAVHAKSRQKDEYSIEYDGDEVVTCVDDFHPEGVSIYGWLYGISEAAGNQLSPYDAQEIAETMETYLFFGEY